jgi:hypothetical protein
VLRGADCQRVVDRHEDLNGQMDQLSREVSQASGALRGPAVLNDDVLALHPAEVVQLL